jgi:spoIIIJ-associated protein
MSTITRVSASSVEAAARTYDEALIDALEYLDATVDEVRITVLDYGSKGILGIGAKLCRINVCRKPDPERLAERFLSDVIAAMGTQADISKTLQNNHLSIALSGKDMGMFIGKRGQTLDALQYLTSLVVNKEKGDGQYISVSLDTENYRRRRKETLESLAYNLAKKVKATRKNVVLEPMTPNERRIIHSALQNDRFVTTFSEGDDPFRNVVIALKKTPPPPRAPRKPDYGYNRDDNSFKRPSVRGPRKPSSGKPFGQSPSGGKNPE